MKAVASKRPVPFEYLLDGAPKEAIDFIKQCLDLDHTKRMTCEELFGHGLFAKYRNKQFEKEPSQTIVCPIDMLK